MRFNPQSAFHRFETAHFETKGPEAKRRRARRMLLFFTTGRPESIPGNCKVMAKTAPPVTMAGSRIGAFGTDFFWGFRSVSQFAGHSPLFIDGQFRTRYAFAHRARFANRRRSIVALFSTLVCFPTVALPRPAWAIVVGNVPGVVPNVTTNPTSYPGWTQGDPGFGNLSTVGNYVYLGDGWVLSARHVGYSAAGITFQTASGPVNYQVAGTRIVNGTITTGPYYLDYGFGADPFHHYAVSNPSSVPIEGGGSLALTTHTDLQLFRINGDPGLPSLTISSQPLPINFTRNTAPEVLIVGGGASRAAPESHWQVSMPSQNDWIWTSVPSGGNFHGYVLEGPSLRRWGTNRVTDPHPNSGDDPSDPGALDYRSLFAGTVSDTTSVMKLSTGVGIQDIISSFTIYDSQTQPGASSPPYGVANLETQAIGGDSGAAVFFKRGSQWELAGIINSIFTFADQPAAVIYGNATAMTNLSYYNQDYLNSIKDIIESHPDYSIIGDVNLDGIVSGDGTGAVSVDDVSAFVTGWRYNNGLGQGTITSWKNGDLNRDGKTDVVDFLRLRGALNGQIAPAAMAALFGGSAVPEPSALLLAALACGAATLAAARPRRRK
jgi:hypothetical protein